MEAKELAAKFAARVAAAATEKDPQIDLQDHRFVGVSFKVGNGPMVAISAAFGNIVIAQSGGSASAKGIEFPPDPSFPVQPI